VCDPVIAVGALGAVGDAMGVQQANKEKTRAYNHRMKIREGKTMRNHRLYQTKKVYFEQQVDNSKLAAQRAYTKSQISMNNAVTKAMLDNSVDWSKFMKAEGELEAGFSERGIGGKSVARMLLMNKQKLGFGQAARRRALTEASYRLKEGNESTRLKLKNVLNQEFSKVAIQPWNDLPEPPPVLGNANMTFALGMGSAIASGWDSISSSNTSPLKSPTTSWSDMHSSGLLNKPLY